MGEIKSKQKMEAMKKKKNKKSNSKITPHDEKGDDGLGNNCICGSTRHKTEITNPTINEGGGGGDVQLDPHNKED